MLKRVLNAGIQYLHIFTCWIRQIRMGFCLSAAIFKPANSIL